MFLSFSPLLLLSVVLCLILAIWIGRKRHAPGVTPLLALFSAAAVWSAGYAMEIAVTDYAAKIFWAKFQYFGIVTVPLAWVAFAFQYLGQPDWFPRRKSIQRLFSVIPVLSLLLVWSNEAHGLIWSQITLTPGPVSLLDFEYGAWFWIHVGYSYLLLGIGSFWVIARMLTSVRHQRWQIILAIIAVLVPWASNLAYISEMTSFPALDWTPFAFAVAGLLFIISVLRFHFVNIVPIAHQSVLNGLSDCIVVLDSTGRVAEMNPAARKILPHGIRPIGKPLESVMPEVAGWIQPSTLQEEYCADVVHGREPDCRFYRLQVKPLSDAFSAPVGRLIVCHEITELIHEQQRLEQVVLERTETLRQTVSQLQSELVERRQAEQRFEEVVEAAPDALVVVDAGGTIKLVNAQAKHLFGYSKAELLGKDFQELISPRRRQILQDYVDAYVQNPAVAQIDPQLDLRICRKDGQELPVEVSLGPLETSRGLWVACTVRDVSERLEAEQARSRLIEEIRQSQEELSALAYRLQELQEIQLRQIAGVLHDSIGQKLTGLNLGLQLAINKVETASPGELREQLESQLALVEETTQQIRSVMTDLHPPVLDRFGLLSALDWYGSIVAGRTGIAVQVEGRELKPRLQPEVERVLFRIAQEAVNNAVKHSQARRLVVRLAEMDGTACLEVQDDGLGFEPESEQAQKEHPHWGLITMRQRAGSIGGQLQIQSSPGCGTLLTVQVRRDGHER